MPHSMSLSGVARRVFASLLCSAFFVAGAAVGAEPAKPPEPAKSAEPAKKAEPAKDAKPAEKPAQKSVGLNPHIARRLAKAIELFEADKLDEALAIVDELGKRRRLRPPDIAQIHRFRGFIYLAKGNSEGAAVELQKALDEKGLDRFAVQQTTYSLAQLYTQVGKYDKALALIDDWFAAAEAPTADAYFLKAMILMQQENYKAALEPATIAVEMSPAPKESWVRLLVAVYTQLDDYANVAANLERLIVMAPQKKQYWIQLAAVNNHIKQDAKALATMKLADAAELLKEDKEMRQLARLEVARDLPLQCAEKLSAAIAKGIVKADAEAYRMISNCYIAARENDRALEPLAKAGELAADGEMYIRLAQMYLQREKFPEALAVLEKALAKSKPEERAHVQLLIGVAQLGSGHLDDAERAFHAAANDKKLGAAARSYLKFVDDERLKKAAAAQQQALAE